MITVTQAPSVAVRALARLVASTSAFQTLVGATGDTAQEKEDSALAHVYWHETDDRYADDEEDEDESDRNSPRPRAIISDLEEQETESGLASWSATGSLVLTIEAPEPESIEGGDTDAIRDRYDWWTEVYGAIKAQIKTNKYSKPDKYLNVTTIRTIGFGEVRHEGPLYFDVCFEMEFF